MDDDDDDEKEEFSPEGDRGPSELRVPSNMRKGSDLRRVSEESRKSVEVNRRGEIVISFTEPRRRSSVRLERVSFRNHGNFGGLGHLAN